MKLTTLSLAFGLCGALCAQDLSISVSTGTATAGGLCDPFTCTPAPLPVQSGATLTMAMPGAWDTQWVLLSVQPPTCVTVPGIANALIAQPPVVLVLPTLLYWQHIYVDGVGGTTAPCAGWTTVSSFALPPGLPSGLHVVMQALEPAWFGWTFSNAIDLVVL